MTLPCVLNKVSRVALAFQPIQTNKHIFYMFCCGSVQMEKRWVLSLRAFEIGETD